MGEIGGRIEMEANGAALLVLIYSLDGSPSRIEFTGPILDAPSISEFADTMIKRFADKAEEWLTRCRSRRSRLSRRLLLHPPRQGALAAHHCWG